MLCRIGSHQNNEFQSGPRQLLIYLELRGESEQFRAVIVPLMADNESWRRASLLTLSDPLN